jgi:hypothetical protein
MEAAQTLGVLNRWSCEIMMDQWWLYQGQLKSLAFHRFEPRKCRILKENETRCYAGVEGFW